MSIESILARARTRHEDVMSTTVTVARSSGASVFDDQTLTYSAPSSEVYAGPCLLRPATVGALGEMGAVVTYEYVAKFPADTDIARGDAITVTESAYDAGLVGLTVWAQDVMVDEWQVTRTVICIDQIPEVLP